MTTLRRQAYTRFLDALHGGQLKLGQNYTQAELCRLLGLSVNPLQTALKLLEADGFVTIRSRAGIVVNKPDLAEFRECQQLRQILEMAAIGQFAAIADEAMLRALAEDVHDLRSKAHSRAPTATLAEAHDAIEARLHGGIIAALKNKTIERIHRTNMDRFRLMQPKSGSLSHEHFIAAAEEHLAILDASLERDVQAARDALRQHIAASLQRAIMTELFTT